MHSSTVYLSLGLYLNFIMKLLSSLQHMPGLPYCISCHLISPLKQITFLWTFLVVIWKSASLTDEALPRDALSCISHLAFPILSVFSFLVYYSCNVFHILQVFAYLQRGSSSSTLDSRSTNLNGLLSSLTLEGPRVPLLGLEWEVAIRCASTPTLRSVVMSVVCLHFLQI